MSTTVKFVTYATAASIPTAANAVAGGMEFGTVIASKDDGRTRRLIDDNGTPAYTDIQGSGLSGETTIAMGASTSPDVPVTGLKAATGMVVVQLSQAAPDGTVTNVSVVLTDGKFSLKADGNAAAAMTFRWFVQRLS